MKGDGNTVGSLRDPVTTVPPGGTMADSVSNRGKSLAAITRRPRTESVDYLGWYISGCVDGEGCFCISVNPRSGLRTGWEIRPSFSVSQNAGRSEPLTLLKAFFGGGTIRPDRSDQTLKYEIRSLEKLLTTVIPHFERYPLLSSKQTAFEAFARICRAMADGEHRDPDAVRSLLRQAAGINSGPRKYQFGKI